MNFLPLPEPATRLLVDRLEYTGDQIKREGITHCGLLLDRFAPYRTANYREFDQTDQKLHIDRIAATSAYGDHELLMEWSGLVTDLPGVRTWEQRTVWRLAAHLARATTLENGSACLHPLYGFAYLPGSGLKGMARAWAHQQNAESPTKTQQDLIRRVFGSFDQPTHAKDRPVEWSEAAGSVVFLESWPKTWPKLECDIVNNHHPEYFRKQGVQAAPGDWEQPNPTYFLTVKAGTTFRFAVAPRDPLHADAQDDTAAAMRWLQEALYNLGAGAKTGAGYGYFQRTEDS